MPIICNIIEEKLTSKILICYLICETNKKISLITISLYKKLLTYFY